MPSDTAARVADVKVLGQVGRAGVVMLGTVAMVASGAGVAGAATSHRARVMIHVSGSGYVHGPSTTRPGRAHLHIDNRDQSVLLVRRRHAGTATLAKDVHRSSPAKLFKDFTFVGLFVRDGYTTLSRGTYYVIAPAEHQSAAKVATVRVAGKHIDAAAPASEYFRVDSHHALHAAADQSRHGYVHLVNSSSAPEELLLLGLAKDVSMADIDAYLKQPSEANLNKLDTVNFELGGLVGAHHQVWTAASVQSRRYIAALLPLSGHGFTLRSPRLVTIH